MVTIHIKKLRSLIVPCLLSLVFQSARTMSIKWESISGYGDNVAVGPSGQVIHVNAESQGIFWGNGISATNYKPIGWTQLNGGLSEASIGLNGIIWGVNSASEIWYTTTYGAAWTKVGGTLVDVAVGPNGNVWGVQSSGNIFINKSGYGWYQIDGALKQISVGKNDMVVGVNANGQAYIRVGTPGEGSSWTHINPGSPEPFNYISAGHDGCVWAIGTSGKLYFWQNNTTWVNVNIPVALKVVKGSHNGQVWAIGTNRNIYYGRMQPGGVTYVYPKEAATGTIGIEFASTTWKLPKVGYGVIKFQVRAASDFGLVIAPSAATTGDLYFVGIGYTNTKAVIRRKLSSATTDNVAEFNLTDAQKLNANQYVNYWIRINNGRVTMGTGTVAGKNQFLVYNDPSPLATVQYVGFGGYEQSPAAYQNISFESVPESFIPGGTTFTYPGDASAFSMSFADAWKLPVTGKGIIKFTAKGANNLAVTLAPSKASRGNLYYFGLGYDNCSVGYIRRILTDDGTYNTTSATIAGTAAQLNTAEDRPYWIKIDGGAMAMGTGTVVGQNQIMAYTDASPLAVQYIGFGGYFGSSVEYKNITIENLSALIVAQFQTAVEAIPDPTTNFNTALSQINAVLTNQSFINQTTVNVTSLVTKIQTLVTNNFNKGSTVLGQIKTLFDNAAKTSYLKNNTTLTSLLTTFTKHADAQTFVDSIKNKTVSELRTLLGGTLNFTYEHLTGKKATPAA